MTYDILPELFIALDRRGSVSLEAPVSPRPCSGHCVAESAHLEARSDRPHLRLPPPSGLPLLLLGFSCGLRVASNTIADNIWPVTILPSQTLPFCIFVTHCRFCEDCFIIFVYHLLHSIWYLARIFSSILSDINKIQPVHRLSGSTFASLMCWKIILLCSRQLEKPGILIVNQCVRSIPPPLFLVISSNAFLVRWQRTSIYKTERVQIIFLLLST